MACFLNKFQLPVRNDTCQERETIAQAINSYHSSEVGRRSAALYKLSGLLCNFAELSSQSLIM